MAAPALHASNGSGLTSANVETVWKAVIEKVDGVTKEMAASYEKLDLSEPGHLVVTLENRVSKEVCSKPDKKIMFEGLLNEVSGQTIRVDFLASANVVTRAAAAPKMSRPQQIRQLHDNAFVKQAMSLFDAEIVEYHDPLPTRKR